MRIEYAENPLFMAPLTAGTTVFVPEDGFALGQRGHYGTTVFLRSHELLLGRQWALSGIDNVGLRATVPAHYDEAEIRAADYFKVVNVRYRSQNTGPGADLIRECEVHRMAEDIGCAPEDISNDPSFMLDKVHTRLYNEFAFDKPYRVTLVPMKATPGEAALIESNWAEDVSEAVAFWRDRELAHAGHEHMRRKWELDRTFKHLEKGSDRD